MEFTTTSMDKAIFLMCKGKNVINVKENADDYRRKIIVFNDEDNECNKLVQAYDYAPRDNDEVMIDVRDWFSNSKKIKQLLYGDK